MASYSDQQRVDALAALTANGGNLAKTARDTGIPRQTLQEWQRGRVPEGVPEIRHHVETCLADRIEGLLGVIVGELHKKAESAKFSELAFGMEKATNAMRLLRGEATTISENRGLTEDERADRLATLLEQGEKRAGVPAPDGRGAGRGRPAPGSAVH